MKDLELCLTTGDSDKASAYVSYSDEILGSHFVHNKLLPALEGKRKHRLLLHHRDTVLGKRQCNATVLEICLHNMWM